MKSCACIPSADLKKHYGSAKNQPGFIAEEALTVVPDLVSLDADGLPSGFDYPKLTAVLTKAIQEMNLRIETIASTTANPSIESQTFAESFFESVFARTRAWLADAANGVGDLFAGRVKTKELCVRDDSGAETCITKLQLDSLLSGVAAGQGGGGGGTPSPSPTPEPEPTPAEPTPEPLDESPTTPSEPSDEQPAEQDVVAEPAPPVDEAPTTPSDPWDEQSAATADVVAEPAPPVDEPPAEEASAALPSAPETP